VKKIFAFLLVALMVTAFVSCADGSDELIEESLTKSGNAAIQSSDNQQNPTTEASVSNTTTTTESSTSTLSKEGISSKLAKLTNEDGTGTIYLGMKREKVRSILDKEGIPYSVDKSLGTDGSISFEDGTWYSVYEELERIEFRQTGKGLKIGDTAQKAKELYGDIEVEATGSHFNYRYNYHLGEQNDVTLRIAVDGIEDSAKVMEIEIYKWPSQVYESRNSEGGAA